MRRLGFIVFVLGLFAMQTLHLSAVALPKVDATSLRPNLAHAQSISE